MASSIFDNLRGRPGLRRQLRGLGSGRLAEIESSLSGIDPKRFRSQYRQSLQAIIENENNAQPVQERMEIEERLKSPNMTGSQRDILRDNLRRNEAGWGTAAARNDPFRWGSAAQTRFGSLYRR